MYGRVMPSSFLIRVNGKSFVGGSRCLATKAKETKEVKEKTPKKVKTEKKIEEAKPKRKSSKEIISPLPPKEGVNWGAMSFSLTKTDFMALAQTKQGTPFKKAEIIPYGAIPLEPSATIFNYGQGIFEGIKAFRTAKGRIAIFRPFENSKRFRDGANAFMMEEVSDEIFIDALDKVTIANSQWIPPENQGALYLRPLLFGSGPHLGVGPSNEYTFCIFASPVGNYFKGGQVAINLITSTDHHRSPPKGAGYVKAAGNYAPCFKTQKKAKSQGYDEALFLDSVHENFVEEAGASNFFILDKDGVLRTPPTRGTILPGVTRNSIIRLARDKFNLKVDDENYVPLDLVKTAKEAFCTGTGAAISPVGTMTHNGTKHIIGDGKVGSLTASLYKMLLDIQHERIPDEYNWLHYPYGKK